MFTKILVPTDVSEPSQHALLQALQLAQKFSAEIVLLNVTHTPKAYLGYAASYGVFITEEQLEELGEAALEATLTGIDVGQVPIKRKHLAGYPASIILEQIEEEKIDLVVMGTHGHGPLTGAVIGSVSQRVLAQAKCPVLFVK